MCGVHIIYRKNRPIEKGAIEQMVFATRHRGPDASGTKDLKFENGAVHLGSNRLQIIDKNEASNQPLTSVCGRYHLVFNGEIYNYQTLKNKLLSDGTVFSTASDTEVVLQWLIHNGKEGVGDFNGMYAFIFVDVKTNYIVCGRDSSGIKPLFYYKDEDTLVAASEIKAILASGLVPKKLNKEAIPSYLAYKYVFAPHTFYNGIYELPPGSLLEIFSNGTSKQYAFKRNIEPHSHSLKELLTDAMANQYDPSNGTAIMLSGGVDSTLVLAILAKEFGYKGIPVYSIAANSVHQKEATDDGLFAPKAAKLFEADYHPITITQQSFNQVATYLETVDQPVADSAGFLTWLVANEAKDKSKVLLSGAGADELFAGYNRHRAFAAYLKNREKPWFKFLLKHKHLPMALPMGDQMHKLTYAIHEDPSITFNNFLQTEQFGKAESLWAPQQHSEQHLRQALTHDLEHYLPSDVLYLTDQATMQRSIEARVPFLDASVVAYTQSVKAFDLLNPSPKWMLKELLSAYGGKLFANRKKQGFGLPLSRWIGSNNLWEFNSKEQYIHEFVSAKKIWNLVQLHKKQKQNYSQELWRVLVLHHWLNANF